MPRYSTRIHTALFQQLPLFMSQSDSPNQEYCCARDVAPDAILLRAALNDDATFLRDDLNDLDGIVTEEDFNVQPSGENSLLSG